MDTGRTALLFFYGLFWATVISGAGSYKAFDTASWWSRSGHRSRYTLRFTMALLLLNVGPIFWLWFVYERVIPDSRGFLPFAAAAAAALSVFGFTRLFHAIVCTSKWRMFYEEGDFSCCRLMSPDETPSFWAHFGPGLLYIILPVIVARLLLLI